MKKVRIWLAHRGITARVLLLYSILVFLPFIFLIIFISTFISNNTINELSKTTQDTLKIAASSIHLKLNNYRDVSMALYYDGTVDMLSQHESLSTDQIEKLKASLESCSNSSTGVQSVYVKTRDGSVYYGGASFNELLNQMNSYENEIIDAAGQCLWYPTYDLHGSAYECKYVLARSLYSKNKENVGIFYMVIDANMIENYFESLSTEYASWYVLDDNGTIIYSSDSAYSGKSLDISSINQNKIENNWRGKNKGGIACYYVSSQLMDTHWFCVSEIRLDAMERNIFLLVIPLLLGAVIYIVFLIAALYMLRKYVLSPLKQLKESMDDYAKGTLTEKQISIFGIGEFQSLSRHFNEMTHRISNLMTEYKQEVDEKNRQKMNAMTAQLTPHFIYNSLNTIKWIAVLNHQEQIQKLVESLVYIFMNAAKADDLGYTVGDELELIRNYSVIQKARFMNFDLVIEADPSCMECRIRKLLVQPSVENAIVHGLNRGKIKNSIVRIKVWTDHCLHIIVEDDGVGFDVAEWRKAPKKKNNHTNIGIHNVEEIIALEYGQDYGMEIKSVPQLGTKVIYTLPIIREEGVKA